MNELLVVLITFLSIIIFILFVITFSYFLISEYLLMKNGGDPYGNGWKVDFGDNGELPEIKNN